MIRPGWYSGGEPYTREDGLASVGKGWASLVNQLFDALPNETTVTQVKEKLGSLVVYTENSTTQFDKLKNHICMESCFVCEVCGANGVCRDDDGWYQTLCPVCREIKETAREPFYTDLFMPTMPTIIT